MACGWFKRDLGGVEALVLLIQTLSGMQVSCILALLSCDSRAMRQSQRQQDCSSLYCAPRLTVTLFDASWLDASLTKSTRRRRHSNAADDHNNSNDSNSHRPRGCGGGV